MERITRQKQNNFTIVDNTIMRNPEVSLKAKGFYVLIMSLPDTWDFSINGIISITKESKTAIYSAIKELIDSNYCKKIQIRENGKFKGVDYSFYERPEYNTPFPQNPNTGISETDIPHTENQPQLRTNNSIKDLSNKELTNKEANSEKESTPIKQDPLPIKQEKVSTPSLAESHKWYNWKTDVTKLNDLVDLHFDIFSVRRGQAEYSNRSYIKSMLISSEIEEDYPLQLEAYAKGRKEGLFIETYKVQGWLEKGWSSCVWTKNYEELISKQALKEKQREENVKKYNFKDVSTPTTIAPPKKPVNGFAIQ